MISNFGFITFQKFKNQKRLNFKGNLKYPVFGESYREKRIDELKE